MPPRTAPVGITARAFDNDATNNVVTYSLFSTRGGRFAIDPVTGVVTVANGALLDAEAQNVWTISVVATSQDGSSSVRDFTINLSDIDEFDVAGVFDVNNAVNAVNENAPNGTPSESRPSRSIRIRRRWHQLLAARQRGWPVRHQLLDGCCHGGQRRLDRPGGAGLVDHHHPGHQPGRFRQRQGLHDRRPRRG